MLAARQSWAPRDRKEDLVSRIDWNKAGERFFETGIDQVVLYPPLGPGVPWNGVTAVNEGNQGGDLEPLYFDGIKYMDFASSSDFQAQLDAFSAPAEFGPCDGQKQLSPGLFVTQQPRKTFGLCYRTLKGNDLIGTEYGYKLHLVWNCTAAPSGKNNSTISSTVTPDTRSWQINTVPPPATNFKPTAHIVLDSNLIEPYAMEQIEALLYGHDGADAYLPTVTEIVAVLDTRIPELVTEFI
jgi:hypothetical protein